MSLNDDLISFWRLNEASGTRSDFVTTTPNDLTEVGSVPSLSGIVVNAANIGPGAGTNYLEKAAASELTFGDEDFTISLWVYLENNTNQQGLISKWNSNAVNEREWAMFFLSGTEVFRFAVSSDGTLSNNVDSASTPAIEQFHHVVCWHDSVANTINMVVNNGATQSIGHSTGVHSIAANPFWLGRIQLGVGDTDMDGGRIDAVGVWNRVLTSDEISELWNSGDGLEPPFPIDISELNRLWLFV